MMVDCNTRRRHAKQEHPVPVSRDAKSSGRSAAAHERATPRRGRHPRLQL